MHWKHYFTSHFALSTCMYQKLLKIGDYLKINTIYWISVLRYNIIVPPGYYKRGWMHLIYDFFGIGTFQPILIKKFFKWYCQLMTIFMLFNFAFHHFFDWRDLKSTNCKKLDFKSFLEKMQFFAICGFLVPPIHREAEWRIWAKRTIL